MNLQYMNLGITETDCTQSLRFWSNFDPKLPSEDGQNQKQQSGYPNKVKSMPYLLSTFNKDYNFFCFIWAFFGYKWVIRPGSKIKKSQLRLAPLFEKPFIGFSDPFLTLHFDFFRATDKEWWNQLDFQMQNFMLNHLKKN